MNIKVQCCGIVLMLVILFFYGRQKKIRLNTEKAFFRMFCTIMVSLFMDILSLVALTHMEVLPVIVVDLVCKGYLATLVLSALCGVLYVCTDIYGGSSRYRKIISFYWAAAGFGIILMFVLPIYKIYRSEAEIYTYGPSAMVTYAFSFLFFISALVLMQRHKDSMNPRRREAVYIWIALWIIAAVIQFIFKELLVVGYAGAVGVMVIYLKLENPETNLDRQSGFYNQTALFQYINQMFGKDQEFSILCLIFSRSMTNNVTSEEEQQVRREVIEFIMEISDALAFKNEEDEIALLFRNKDKAEECEAMLKRRFEFGWGQNSTVFVNPHFMYMPKIRIVDQPEDILYLLRYARQNSKDFGESQSLIIDRTIADHMYEEKKVEQLILGAIEENRVEVYYQPIFSTKEQCFTSAEALVRIRDENDQIVPPGVFIDIAEKNGMIIQLGEIIFEKVCLFLKQHHPAQLGIHYIEVNLSVVQCAYEHLADSFVRIMEGYGIDPRWINLEITESASISAKKVLSNNMKTLMDYGVHFSLDDFGTGQSNLNYIVEMPVNIVKFDRSMISAYFENGKAKYVMDAAMHMIHGMELQIVSEGIETKEQFHIMEDLGISYIQGYYFSKPLSPMEFLEFLAKQRR